MWPNLWRVVNLIHILLILAHWFGCFYFLLSEAEGFQVNFEILLLITLLGTHKMKKGLKIKTHRQQILSLHKIFITAQLT